jgi:nucleotide-binding universal stress UspA family protein
MFKRILVPLDGSALAEAVLPQVRELAKALGAELLLLRVTHAHVFPGVNAVEEEVQVVQKAESYLAELARRLESEGLSVQTAVRYGEAAEGILRHITDNQVDLVAMSMHGRSSFSRLVVGSVAAHVVQHTAVPVLLVRGRAGDPT